MVSLYIHIPFCRSKCVYCDFNSYAGLEHLHQPYLEALALEIARAGRELSSPAVATIYLGGGTPTVLSLEGLGRILQACREAFAVDEEAEVTSEANPGTIDLGYLEGLLGLGVGRLSLGVQSLQDEELGLLGRIHTASEAQACYRMARRAGFRNINLDLIYGLPGQTMESWEYTLREALAWEPEHLSLYSLSLEPGTPLEAEVAQGWLPRPDEDLAAEMYLLAEGLLEEAGYDHYEISNWALPGYQCRHNLTYWHNQDYLGFGAGAHSRLPGRRYWNLRPPEEYIRRLLSGGSAVEGQEAIDGSLEMAETMILGLRLVEGVCFREFKARFGRDPTELYGNEIRELVNLGLLEADGSGIRLTQRGRLLGNEVFERFL